MRYIIYCAIYYLITGLITSFTTLSLNGFNVAAWTEAGRMCFSLGVLGVLLWVYADIQAHKLTDYNEDRDTGQDYNVND